MRFLPIAAVSLFFLTPAQAAAPEATAPQTPQNKESLSEKLDKGKGVITPPSDVDPGIARPAPELPNTTPVIPPPAPGAK